MHSTQPQLSCLSNDDNPYDAAFFTGGVTLVVTLRALLSINHLSVLHIHSKPCLPKIGVYNTPHRMYRYRSPSQIIQDIIPQSLLATYSPDKLHFNVTESMLEQSRPIKGNTQRLHSYIKKLRNKECTTVVVSGGSVTGGQSLCRTHRPYLQILFLNQTIYRSQCRRPQRCISKAFH